MLRDSITRRGRTLAVAMGASLALANSASALVLVEGSEEQQLRANIQRQQHKYVRCLVAAAVKCEKSGVLAAAECDLKTSTAVPPANGTGKFAGNIAKCDAKLNYADSLVALTPTTAYTAMGCPGDSNPATQPDEPFADITGWQADTPPATKTQIQTLALAMGAVSGCNAKPDPQTCQTAEVKRVANYSFAIQKCQRKCETDFNNEKGNGGVTDDANNCSMDSTGTAGGGNVLFNDCVGKAYAKAIKNSPFPPVVASIVLPALAKAVSDANNDVNNENDCP